ncbi:MAG: hypothetical protein GC154_14920 [bacterium]|nr:hypothetical protein [bacterium]
MSQFRYKALQADGGMTEGVIEAQGRQDAIARLESKGWKPIQIAEQAAAAPKKSASFALPVFSRRISYHDLENFTRLLASLLAAGVPLSRALVILQREAANPAASERWKEIHDCVIDGMSLADAMAQKPQPFSRIYIAMVQAGETGGFLDVVLSQIADFQSREKDLRSKVSTALIYPSVLMGLAVCVLIFLLTFFIPRFQKIFSGFGAELPMITQIIIGASHAVRNYGIFILLGIGILAWFVRNWLESENGSRAWQRILLNLPVLGPLSARFAMTRFCRMLGTLIGAGVPLIQGLNVARKSIHNAILFDAVSDSIERVKKGDPLASSLSQCPQLFPASILEMISIAEETGRLDQELIRIASDAEEDLDRRLRIAVALAEPLMLFVIAGFIGVIFIGMVIPIFTIQDYIK